MKKREPRIVARVDVVKIIRVGGWAFWRAEVEGAFRAGKRKRRLRYREPSKQQVIRLRDKSRLSL